MSEPNLPYSREEEIIMLLTEDEEHGGISCPCCGNFMETDSPGCYCGWINPLVEEGII